MRKNISGKNAVQPSYHALQRAVAEAVAGYAGQLLVLLPISLLTAASALAQGTAASPSAPIEEVIVFGRNTDLLGRATAATEGSIGGADLLIRPMFKTAELLESMPGMVAVQHSGSGKANQYFLRGFNLDHGTDYTAILDGAPLNLRSHGHGQGYLDVNGLIPETVDRIDYRKGPYRADLGDFAIAGASLIKTVDAFESPFVSAETGVDGWQRYVGGLSRNLGSGTLSMIGEHKQYDGPWENPENLEHFSFWSKYQQQTGFGQAQFTLSVYDASWNPTEQIPERAIGTAACEDAYCSLDPTADGHTTRWIATSQLQGADWNASLYAQYYDWDMKSNPTYDFQIGQFDKRWTFGGAADLTLVENEAWQMTVGASFRYDDADKVELKEFNQGIFVAPIAANALTEGSVGAHLEATWNATDTLRVMSGLRVDHYDFDVTARFAGSSEGQVTDRRASPKFGLAWGVTEGVELYANWGRGFHSNDARGVVNTTDPVPGLSPGTGYEVGARTTLGDFKFTAAVWRLHQDSELIFIGDSNAVEPKGGSRREGEELTMFWQPLDWLGVDAVYTTSDARYIDNVDGPYVENALEEAAQIGLTATRGNWDVSARWRYMGPYALVADNSDRADPLSTLNLRAAHHWNALTVYAELINALDSDDREISYNYPAWVQGLDPAGQTSEDIDCTTVNCRMSRITTPRTFRIGVSYKFL